MKPFHTAKVNDKIKVKINESFLTGTVIELNGYCLNVRWDAEHFNKVSSEIGVITAWSDFQLIA